MKRLSFRFVRRLMLLLALVFPVVYLMGGFVAALAGSHGNVILAQDDEVVTSSQVVDFNQRVNNGNFISTASWSKASSVVSWDVLNPSAVVVTGSSTDNTYLRQSISFVNSHVYYARFDTWLASSYSSCYAFFRVGVFSFSYFNDGSVSTSSQTFSKYFTFGGASGSYLVQIGCRSTDGIEFSYYLNNCMIFDLTQMYGAGNEPTATVFDARYDADYYDYTLSNKIVENTTGIPTYSEYLFNQILGSDNIIKQWGYYALSDEDKGFAPFATMIQIVDDNFFHLGDSNDLGLFVYGYVYYALNIVAIYELVALVVMVFTIPLKLTDRFTKEM